DPHGAMGQRELLNLVFLPGFSTRDRATEISGRGVGLDVVKTNISRLSGLIDLASYPGKGSETVITLPITLAIIQALLIKVAGRTYALPYASVLERVTIGEDEIRHVAGREVLTVAGHGLPLLRLERAFQLKRDDGAPPPTRPTVLVV